MKCFVPLWCRVIGAAMLLGVTPVWAVDPDIAIHTQMRRASVLPLCQAVLAQSEPLSPEQTYQKALGWLYGIEGSQRREPALELLSGLATGMVEAQLALGDSLQDGDAAAQQEALRWYALAAASGDVRASVRRGRLQLRLQAAQMAVNAAAAAAQAAPPGQAADPLFDSMEGAQSQLPGYHCHFYGLNRKVCHAAFDQ